MSVRAFLSFTAVAICTLATVWASADTQAESAHPFFRETLYPRWSEMSAPQLAKDIKEATLRIQKRQQLLEQVTANSATFENTFGAFSRACNEATNIEMLVQHLHYTDNTYKEQETAFFNHLHELREARQCLQGSPIIQHTLTQWAKSPQSSGITPQQRYLVELTLEQFARQSNAEVSTQLAELQKELNRSLNEYERNIRAVENSWQYIFKERRQLDGVPPGTIEAMENTAGRNGIGSAEQPAWLFTLQLRTMADIMKYCHVESTRKKCWQGIKSPGNTRSHDNGPVVMRIMKLRQDIATLKGYKNHADSQAPHTLMGGSKNALAFVDGLLNKIRPRLHALHAAILHRASLQCGKELTAINPWDYEYYCTLATDTLNKFSLQELRPYLEYEHTLQATLKHFCRLYGLTIKEVPTTCIQGNAPCPDGAAEVWHPSIRLFAVYDAVSGKQCGAFYLDAYTRAGRKYGTCTQLISHGTPAMGNTAEQPPLVGLSLELHKPSPGNTQLLSHIELRMLFHELGHVFHLILGDTPHHELAALFVARDFIELPAHLQELRAWEPEVLCEIGRHYRTGAPMPRELAEKAAATRHNEAYISTLNLQLIGAKLDLEMHTHYYEKFHGKNPDSVTESILAPYMLKTTITGPSILRNFKHCIQGYDARYYAYVLAEVMAADIHGEFKRHGLNNSAIGKNYRKTILETGNSRPAAEQYRTFMGRNVSTEAFLKSLV